MSHGIPASGEQVPRHRRVMKQALAVWCCLAFLLAPADLLEAGQAQKPQPESRVEVVGDVRLPQPARFALIRDASTGLVSLHREGEPIFEGDSPLPLGKIVAVEDRALRVAPTNGPDVQIAEGARLPGQRRLIFVRSAWLTALRFQLRYGAAPASNKQYAVVDIQGQRAVLERPAAPGEDLPKASIIAVPGSPRDQKGSLAGGGGIGEPGTVAETVNRIPFAEVGPDTWEIPERNLRELGREAWPLLSETLLGATPVVTFNDGVGLHLNNSLGTGTLDNQGFRIDYMKLAQRTGLEVGDRILSVNDQPVNSAGSLVRLYRQLSSDAGVSELNVLIRRGSEQRTITYRIR
ncbi:MAG: hypothetical protein ACREKR_05500 [Candidatus Methylomirabilales bacterium]